MKIQDNRHKTINWPTVDWYMGFFTGALFGSPIVAYIYAVVAS